MFFIVVKFNQQLEQYLPLSYIMHIRNDSILIDYSDVLLILNNLVALKLLSTARGSEFYSFVYF